jgi:hypothetical protein
MFTILELYYIRFGFLFEEIFKGPHIKVKKIQNGYKRQNCVLKIEKNHGKAKIFLSLWAEGSKTLGTRRLTSNRLFTNLTGGGGHARHLRK